MTRIDQIKYVYPDNEFDDDESGDVIGQAMGLVERCGMHMLRNDEIKEVAVADGKVVGVLYMNIETDEATWSIAVDPEYRRTGIAKHLYSSVMSEIDQYIDSGNPFTLKAELIPPYTLEEFVKSMGYTNTDNIRDFRIYEKHLNVPLDESVEDPTGWLSTHENIDVIAYHGSESVIKKIDFSHAGQQLGDRNFPAMFFTSSKVNADFYGDKVYQAKLHFTKLLSIDDPDEFHRLNEVVGHKMDIGELDIHEDIDMEDIADVILTSMNNLINVAKSVMNSDLGYDGVVFRNILDGHARGDTYVVFDKSVIRSFRLTKPTLTESVVYPGSPPSLHDIERGEDGKLDIRSFSRKMDEHKLRVREFAENSPDMLLFKEGALRHLVSKEPGPHRDRTPWRSTTFGDINGKMTPMGHSNYKTKFDALSDLGTSVMYVQNPTVLEAADLTFRDRTIFSIMSMFKAMNPAHKAEFMKHVVGMSKWQLDKYPDNYLMRLKMIAGDIRDTEKDMAYHNKKDDKEMQKAYDWQREQARKEKEEYEALVRHWQDTGMMDEDRNFIPSDR